MGLETVVGSTAAGVVGLEATTGLPSQIYGAVEQRKARKAAKKEQQAEAARVATEQKEAERQALAERKRQIDTLRKQVLAPQLSGGRQSLITTGRSSMGLG